MIRPICSLLLGLSLAATALPAAAAPPAPTAPAQREAFEVGAQLIATTDVVLREAELLKGTRVRIVKVALKDGRAHALNIELPDGHVLRGIAMHKVRKHFTRAR